MSSEGQALGQMIRRGLHLFDAGHLDEAQRILDSLGAPGEQLAGAHFLAALLLYRRNEPAVALARVRRALALDPAYAAALSFTGILCRSIGMPVESEAASRRDITLRPDYLPTRLNLLNLLLQTQRFAAAAALCRTALVLSPAHPDTWLRLANSLLNIAQGGLAEPALRRASLITPTSMETLRRLVLVRIRLGRPEGAASALRAILAQDPQCGRSLTQLAQMHGERGRLADMRVTYRRASVSDLDAALRVNFPKGAA